MTFIQCVMWTAGEDEWTFQTFHPAALVLLLVTRKQILWRRQGSEVFWFFIYSSQCIYLCSVFKNPAIMDPEAFLELANQVTKLKMYPYYDIAHCVISCLYMREDLSTGEFSTRGKLFLELAAILTLEHLLCPCSCPWSVLIYSHVNLLSSQEVFLFQGDIHSHVGSHACVQYFLEPS